MKGYVAHTYTGRHHAEYCAVLIPWIVKRCGLTPGRVVDAGCGRGDCIGPFVGEGFDVTALDLEPPGQYADVTKRVPFPDGYFDVLFSKSVAEHLREPERMLAEAFRVLKPGGKVVTMVPDWRYCQRGFYDDCTHIRPLSLPSLEEMTKLAGFISVDAFTIRPGIGWLHGPAWVWEIITAVVPYGLLGGQRFCHRRHTMAVAVGTKP
ncbi:MAG: methyltransferase domain-containing protein [Gallionellaceae bacterium]|nr:methyltransferase domain-containing protein [Gallionellaceae bacterium]